MAKVTITNDDGSKFEMEGEITECFFGDEQQKQDWCYWKKLPTNTTFSLKVRLREDRVMPAQPVPTKTQKFIKTETQFIQYAPMRWDEIKAADEEKAKLVQAKKKWLKTIGIQSPEEAAELQEMAKHQQTGLPPIGAPCPEGIGKVIAVVNWDKLAEADTDEAPLFLEASSSYVDDAPQANQESWRDRPPLL